MNRKQLERLAEELNLKLDKASAMEIGSANQKGCKVRWTVREPGYSDGSSFSTLAEVQDYLMIDRCGQEL